MILPNGTMFMYGFRTCISNYTVRYREDTVDYMAMWPKIEAKKVKINSWRKEKFDEIASCNELIVSL